MNELNVKAMPIEIIKIGSRGEIDLKIGDVHAAIIEPNPVTTKLGVVCLCMIKNRNKPLIQCKLFGEVIVDCTDDPRLVKIAEMILTSRITELQPGTVIPPLNE